MMVILGRILYFQREKVERKKKKSYVTLQKLYQVVVLLEKSAVT